MLLESSPLAELDTAVFAEPSGYWHYIRFFRFPALELRDPESDRVVARLTERSAATRVWWNNGPQHYSLVYAQQVTAVSAATTAFHARLLMANQGGGIEFSARISDHVDCRDSARHGVWSFGISSEQSEFMVRAAIEVLEPIVWEPCR